MTQTIFEDQQKRSDRLVLAGLIITVALMIAGVNAVFCIALNSGGHTGSEMSLKAEGMTLQSTLAIFLALIGGMTLSLKSIVRRWGWLLFASGIALSFLASILLVNVYAGFEALDNASRCGTYDRYC